MLTSRLVAIALFAALLSAVPFHAALAQTAPDLGTAESFAVLGGTAVTLTRSAVIGDVGSPVAVTLTTSTVDGTVYPAGDPIAVAAYNEFLAAYDALALEPCGQVFTATTLGSQTFSPGVYCFEAALTLTDVVLTLDGPADGIWIFKIGTLGTGALTGTNFSVVMANGGSPCNVYWWVADAATLTDSNFLGTILAGAAISVTRGTFNGGALAQAAVTMTDTAVSVCGSTVPSWPPEPPWPVPAQCKDYSDYWNHYWNEYWYDYWKDNCKDHWKDHGKYHCKDHEKDYCKDHYCTDHDKDRCKYHDKDNDKDRRDRR